MSAFGLADATLGALTLKQCSDAQQQSNVSVIAARGSGNTFADAHFIDGAAPVFSFSSMDVAGALAANTSLFASAGLYVSGGNGLVLPFSSRQAGSTFQGNGNHTTISCNQGLVIPGSLNIPGTGPASISLEALIESSDGRTNPLTVSTSEDRTAGAFNALYRLYQPSVNGSAVAGVSGVTVNFGISVESDNDLDGFIYPTQHVILEVNPTIDIQFKDKASFEAFGPLFTAQSAAVIKLQKMLAGSTVVAPATAQHITLTFADGIISADRIGGQGTGRGENSLRLTGEQLTVSTTSTL